MINVPLNYDDDDDIINLRVDYGVNAGQYKQKQQPQDDRPVLPSSCGQSKRALPMYGWLVMAAGCNGRRVWFSFPRSNNTSTTNTTASNVTKRNVPARLGCACWNCLDDAVWRFYSDSGWLLGWDAIISKAPIRLTHLCCITATCRNVILTAATYTTRGLVGLSLSCHCDDCAATLNIDENTTNNRSSSRKNMLLCSFVPLTVTCCYCYCYFLLELSAVTVPSAVHDEW